MFGYCFLLKFQFYLFLFLAGGNMFYPFSYIISYLALNDACSIIGSTNKFFDTLALLSQVTLSATDYVSRH